MADSVTGKRITEFTELSSIGTGDFIAVDNASQDTKKYDATKLATKEYADNAVSDAIDDLTIPTEKIEDGAVTTAKIADSNVTTAKIANNAVNESKIADSAVTSNKINNGAVDTAKIADGAVTTAKLGAGAVTSAKLGAYSVTNTKIDENAVRNEHITDGAVTRGKLASNAVTEEKIYEGAVTTDKLGASAVTTGKLADGAVSTAKIADSAVTEGKIGANAVTNAKIANNAVNADKIANSAVTTDKINNGAVATAKINDNAVTTAKINDGAVTEGKLGSNAVTTTKINDGAVTESKIANSAVTENKIADGAVTEDKLGEDVAEILDNKAEIDGYYEDLTAGSSEQLLSNTYIPDTDPYLFRTTAGSKEVGDRVYEDAIVGVSMPWNQIISSARETSTIGNLVYTNKNTFTTEMTGTGGDSVTRISNSNMRFIATHKYFVSWGVKFPSGSYVCTGNNAYNGAVDADDRTSGIINCLTSSSNLYLGLYAPNTTFNHTYTLCCTDLTLMFGSTIADYAYTLEQSEAGSGIAWLKSQGFFTKDYYAYDAGSIKSVQTSAKKVVGFNQWDEQWKQGYYSLETGAWSDANNRICSKNMIPVIPNTAYHITVPYGTNYVADVFYYDINGNYLGYKNDRYTRNFTTPSNCSFIYFSTWGVYGNVYNHDICINFHWDGERDGEYEPYVEHTYPLGNDELRGLFKLSNGKIYADGDIKTSDGQITRKYSAPLDLGTLNWTTTSASNVYITTNEITDMVRAGINDSPQLDILCGRYVATPTITLAVNMPNKLCSINSAGKKLMIKDSAYATAEALKTALSGIYFQYPLETPTTESADPYTSPQIVSNWGTEQFVDERDVPVPVGHNSRYLPDLKAKLESAPNNPSTNGKYFLQYENGQATYVPVPSEVPQTPSEDGTYILKATVASGVATLAWVAEE